MTLWGFWVVAALSSQTSGRPFTISRRIGKSRRTASTSKSSEARFKFAGSGRAHRNLEGVRKCLLHAVWQAQGQGCAPGALGVCIGSDRAHGYDVAKEQLFRTLDDVNPNPALAK